MITPIDIRVLFTVCLNKCKLKVTPFALICDSRLKEKRDKWEWKTQRKSFLFVSF
jgi:hypothetical protein